jgi:hypothetical protein
MLFTVSCKIFEFIFLRIGFFLWFIGVAFYLYSFESLEFFIELFGENVDYN